MVRTKGKKGRLSAVFRKIKLPYSFTIVIPLNAIIFEASFHFTLSTKDKQILVVPGHEFHLKRKTLNCRATVITDGGSFFLK